MAYTIGEVSEKLNVSVHTLRYYENEGLLAPIDRDTNGRRVFKPRDLIMLNTIECLKSTGMPIKEIKKYIEWCSEGDSTTQLRYDLFLDRKQVVIDQLNFLNNIMNGIKLKCDFYEKALNDFEQSK